MSNFLMDAISNTGRFFNAPVLFDWDSSAAKDDAAAGNGKRDVTSVAYKEVNQNKEKYRAGGKIYNYAGDVIGTYDQGFSGAPGDGGGSGDPQAQGGAVYSGPTRDRAAEAFYEAGINNIDSLINSLGGREQSALASLMASYLQSKQRAQVAYGDNEADYNKNVDNITRNDARKKSQIDTNVRNDMSSLRRVLGARGAGSSSSFQEVVPTAVAAKGSSDRSDAAQVTAENMDQVNTNWDRYRREYEQNLVDAETDRANNEKDIKSQFAQQGIDARQKKLELETNLASARGGNAAAQSSARSVAGEINALQQRINELAERSAGRTVTTKDATMQQSENKDFNAGANTSTAQTQPGTQQDETGYYNPEEQKKTDEDLLKELLGL